jgi:hypothetical protein
MLQPMNSVGMRKATKGRLASFDSKGSIMDLSNNDQPGSTGPSTMSATTTVSRRKPVKTKRLTLDIPEQLHRAIKINAAQTGVTMAERLRVLLLEHYGFRSNGLPKR